LNQLFITSVALVVNIRDHTWATCLLEWIM